MSQFAAYCRFVRNQHSKQAAWQDDLLAAAQANPELAGAAVGGLGGAATGIFSGNMLRNGLIGAGLGAGAGLGYRFKDDISKMWNGKDPKNEVVGPPAPNPLQKEMNKEVPKPSGVKLPAAGQTKSIGEETGPPKKLGLPSPGGKTKAPSAETVADQQQAHEKAVSAPGFKEAPATAADDIRAETTKSPNNPLATLMGGEGVADSELGAQSDIGKPPVTPTTKEQGAASAARRNNVVGQIEQIFKGTPLEGKDPNKLSLQDKLLLSPLQKEMLEVYNTIRPTPGTSEPGAIDKAVAATGQKLIDTGEGAQALVAGAGHGVTNATEAVKATTAAGAKAVSNAAGAPGRWIESMSAAEKAKAEEERRMLEEIKKLVQQAQ